MYCAQYKISADVYKLMFVPQINVPWELNTWGALETLLPKFSQCAKGLAVSRGPHVIAAFTNHIWWQLRI